MPADGAHHPSNVVSFEPGLRRIGEALTRAPIPQMSEIMRTVPARSSEPGAFVCQGCGGSGEDIIDKGLRKTEPCTNCHGFGHLRLEPASLKLARHILAPFAPTGGEAA